MGARRSTTLTIIINVVVLVATTLIGVVATELFTHLPKVSILGRSLLPTEDRLVHHQILSGCGRPIMPPRGRLWPGSRVPRG